MPELPICPECYESVNENSKKCPHCTSDLPSKGKQYAYLILGLLFLPITPVFLYLTWGAVDILSDFLAVTGILDLFISGAFIGVLLSIGLMGPVCIVMAIGERQKYKVMTKGAIGSKERSEHYTQSEGQYNSRVEEIINNTYDGIASTTDSIKSGIPNEMWPLGVVFGSLLWLSIWFLLNHESAFGVVLFGAWVILPISIYYDSRNVKQENEWSPRWWAYTSVSVLPIIAPIFGLVWMLRRKQKTGSWLR